MRACRVFSCVMLIALTASAAFCASFHFTVTADPRNDDAGYDAVLAQMKQKIGGQGAFQICAGDLDAPAKLRARITARFGRSALWFAAIGNHDSASSDAMTWLRDEYTTGHDGRAPLKTNTKRSGPAGCAETTYSWNYGNAHFVMLNEYWNGETKPGGDAGNSGDVCTALYKWLAADLSANKKPVVFVIGHEPAFPQNRHVGDSLDRHPASRDAFWKLLESKHVFAYFCGHTHYFSVISRPGGHVRQIDAGNTRNADNDGNTFINVTVFAKSVRCDVWRDGGKGTFALEKTWNAPIKRTHN